MPKKIKYTKSYNVINKNQLNLTLLRWNIKSVWLFKPQKLLLEFYKIFLQKNKLILKMSKNLRNFIKKPYKILQ